MLKIWARRTWDYTKTSIFGGLIILVPIGILGWIFKTVASFTKPLSDTLLGWFPIPEIFGDIVGVTALIFVSFVVGNFARLRIGKSHPWRWFEARTFDRFRGYRMIRNPLKRVLKQGDEDDKDPFKYGAYARLGETGTLTLCLVSSDHPHLGKLSICVPTGPLPPFGFNHLVSEENVYILHDVPIDRVWEVILGCGAGSESLVATCAELYPHLFEKKPPL